MAIFEANRRYACEACNGNVFKEEERFIIEEEADTSKLNNPVKLRRKAAAKVIVCAKCNHVVNNKVEDSIK